MKEILVLSHCILNNASKVFQDESLLEDEYRQRNRLLELALTKGVQLLQLPCPEFMLYGSRRWGHVKDQFAHPHFRRESAGMLAPVLEQLEEYSAYPDDFRVIGIVSVEGSPSCGAFRTCRADWRGEIEGSLTDPAVSDEPGAFMEILIGILKDSGLDVDVITMEDAIGIMETM